MRSHSSPTPPPTRLTLPLATPRHEHLHKSRDRDTRWMLRPQALTLVVEANRARGAHRFRKAFFEPFHANRTREPHLRLGRRSPPRRSSRGSSARKNSSSRTIEEPSSRTPRHRPSLPTTHRRAAAPRDPDTRATSIEASWPRPAPHPNDCECGLRCARDRRARATRRAPFGSIP